MAGMTTLLHQPTPDTTADALLAEVRRHGFAVHHVTGDDTRPSWSHTVGLHRLDHPELVVLGVTADAGRSVVHWIVDLLRAGEPLVPGRDRPYEFLGVPIRLVPVPARCWDDGNDLLAACGAVPPTHGRSPEALQVVWADRAGRFPWERAFDSDLTAVQPLLEHRWTRWQRA